jgi:hypothetical protein
VGKKGGAFLVQAFIFSLVTSNGQILEAPIRAAEPASSGRDSAPVQTEADASLRWAEFIAKLGTLVGIQVPLGYEDDTGFHFGVRNG